MKWISIVKRRLREGKTYEDFRRAWYHTVGFGSRTRLYTAINVSDPREVIVVAMGEVDPHRDPRELLRIDVEERREHPLDAVIEPNIGRTFGLMVSEDDFSLAGKTEYRPATLDGKETNLEEVVRALDVAQKLIAQSARERDRARPSAK
ncbi:MAG: ROK family protein [Thermoplasmata archaeon]